MSLRVLVCGGKAYADRNTVKQVLDAVMAQHGISCILIGSTVGAAALAQRWAEDEGVCCILVKAQWRKYKYGSAAVRDDWILEHCKPVELAIAFPGPRGGADMIEKAKAAHIDVLEVRPKKTITSAAGDAMTVRSMRRKLGRKVRLLEG